MSAFDMVVAAIIVVVLVLVGVFIAMAARHDSWIERCERQGGVPVGSIKHRACIAAEAVLIVK